MVSTNEDRNGLEGGLAARLSNHKSMKMETDVTMHATIPQAISELFC